MVSYWRRNQQPCCRDSGQISAFRIIIKLIRPKPVLSCYTADIISFRLKGKVARTETANSAHTATLPKRQQKIVLFSGISILVLVPVFKNSYRPSTLYGDFTGSGRSLDNY